VLISSRLAPGNRARSHESILSGESRNASKRVKKVSLKERSLKPHPTKGIRKIKDVRRLNGDERRKAPELLRLLEEVLLGPAVLKEKGNELPHVTSWG